MNTNTTLRHTALFLSAILVFLLGGCSTLSNLSGEKKVSVSLDQSVDTSEGRIIILPIMLANSGNFSAANTQFDNTALNTVLLKSWADDIDDDTFMVTKSMLNKLPYGWDAVELIVRSMDESREVRSNSETLQKFFKSVRELAGEGTIAIGLVFQDEATYKSAQMLRFHAGLYDMKTAKFKWITNAVSQQKVPVPYQLSLQQLVDASFEALKEKNNGLVR